MIQVNKLPVLVIHNAYLYKGGEDTVVANEIESLRKNGFQVYYKEYTNTNFDKISLKTLLTPLNTIFNIFSFFSLIYFIRSKNIKVVHAHNIFYTVSPSVFWAAKIAGARTVMTIHNYRLFCLSANFFRSNRNCFECNDTNSFKPGLQYKCFKKSWFASFILALSIRFNDVIGSWKNKIDVYIVLNEFTRQLYINKGIAPNKIIVKANFLPVSELSYSVTSKENYYLFAGRLTAEKGITHLLKAFSNNKKQLVIAGDGELVDLVKSSIDANINYIGLQSKVQTQALMLKCKALIFPSIWIESMPMSIIEAQSLGTIPIVAASINTNNMIEHGVDGFLYTAGDAEALNNILSEFESLSPNELATISANAINKSLKIYGEIAHIEKIKEIYTTSLSMS